MTDRMAVMGQVIECEACELYEQCTAPVFMSMSTSASSMFMKAAKLAPSVAILGEAPGEQEDAQGAPFVGPSGRLLRDLLKAAGFDPDGVAYINTVSCYPHGTPTWDHIKACAANRDAQIALADPTFVLCVGKVPTKAINPNLDMKHGRGRPWLHEGRIYMSTYHPAAALRNGNYETALAGDLSTFYDLVCAGPKNWIDFIPMTCSGCTKEMYWMQENGLVWCLEDVPHPDFEKAQKWRARQELDLQVARNGQDSVVDETRVDRDEVGGGAVGNKHPQTSRIAAQTVRRGSQQYALLQHLFHAGVRGSTCAEAQDPVARDIGHEISRNQVATRMGELEEKELVERRQTGTEADGSPIYFDRVTEPPNRAAVWFITDRGRTEVTR